MDMINNNCLCFNLKRTSRVFTKFFNIKLKECGVSSTQLPLLMTISKFKGETVTRISKYLDSDRSTLSRNLIPLIKKRFIEQIKLVDSRETGYVITEKGEEHLENAIVLWDKTCEEFINKVGLDTYNLFLEELKLFRGFSNKFYDSLKVKNKKL